MEDFLNSLEGLEVIDTFERDDGAIGIMFDEGKILYVAPGQDVTTSESYGSDDFWARMKVNSA